MVALDIFLVVAVIANWLGAAGFVRLRAPLDRLHAVTFVNVVGGIAIVLAALTTDGPTDRVAKILLLVVANLLAGATISHAIARALRQRERAE